MVRRIARLARKIALRGYDPSVLEDDCFLSFVASLNPEFRVPSRLAIEKVCDSIFDEAREDVFFRLRCPRGRVSLAVGKVRTVEGEILYTACHFIDDEWNLHKVIMDGYVDLPFPSYHGPLLGVHDVYLCALDGMSISIDKVMKDLLQRNVLDSNNLFMMLWDNTTDEDISLELRNQIEEKRFSTNKMMRTEVLICTTFISWTTSFTPFTTGNSGGTRQSP